MTDFTIQHIVYNGRQYFPKAEDLKKLAQSIEESEGQEQYEIRCPLCHFLKAYVIGEKKGIVRMKCSKCGYDGPMNLAYFRRIRREQEKLRYEPDKYGPDK